MLLPPRTLGISLRSTIFLVTLLISGCDIVGADRAHFSEPRYYTHDFFNSYEECVAAQPDPDFWINCSQTAVFCPDGRAELMLTDIIHQGRYTIEDRRITLRFLSSPEIDAPVVFTLATDGQSLAEQASGTRWTRKVDEEATAVAHICL